MLFNSVTYLLLFLPIVVVGNWLLPLRARQWLIIVSSLLFYGFWRFDFIPLVLFSALLDYYLALWIASIDEPRRRLRLLLISMAANLAILGFFKYLAFAVNSVGSLASLLGYELGHVELNIILPLGISFYIFQTMSYTIDVYRREIQPQRDVLTYLCFVTFFAHMIAGPILRAAVLIPQFVHRPRFEDSLLLEGLKRILTGLFLKVVMADSIAGFVDAGFARPAESLGLLDAWTLTFLFGFQIYFDFAGYSHIAIGSAKMMGITLPENFDFPYLAPSPRAFWQRWHISLSTWIRDYLYLPLLGVFHSSKDRQFDTMSGEGSGRTGAQRGVALFGTWTIMGLWHGANWTFAIWGLYHAMMVQLHRLICGRDEGLAPWRLAMGFAVTLPLMMAGWVPFRCQTVDDTLTMWGRMLDVRSLRVMTLPPNAYMIAAITLVGMLAVWACSRYLQPRLARMGGVGDALATAYYAVAIAIVFVSLEVKNQFIYFQF
jgi:alginate O-acetyltransferase complex protein AlgI